MPVGRERRVGRADGLAAARRAEGHNPSGEFGGESAQSREQGRHGAVVSVCGGWWGGRSAAERQREAGSDRATERGDSDTVENHGLFTARMVGADAIRPPERPCARPLRRLARHLRHRRQVLRGIQDVADERQWTAMERRWTASDKAVDNGLLVAVRLISLRMRSIRGEITSANASPAGPVC